MLPAPRHHIALAPRAGWWRALARRPLAERLLLATVATIMLMAGLSSVGGTYAMWRDSADLDAGTVTTGSASLTADWNSVSDAGPWQNLLPGEDAQQSLVLANTGDVPLELSATTPTTADGFEVRVMAEAGEGTRLSTSALGAAAEPLSATGATGAAVVLDTGEAVDVWVEVTATDALTPEESADFEIRFEGRQAQ